MDIHIPAVLGACAVKHPLYAHGIAALTVSADERYLLCLFGGYENSDGVAAVINREPRVLTAVEDIAQHLAFVNDGLVVEILRETKRLVFLRGIVEQGDNKVGAFSATIRKGRRQ